MPLFDITSKDGRTQTVNAANEEAIRAGQYEVVPETFRGQELSPEASETRREIEKEVLPPVEAMARGVARGIPGGGDYSDEVLAKINTLFDRGDYTRELEGQRNRSVKLKGDYPKLSTASEVGGGILGTLGLLKAGGKAFPKALGPKALEKFNEQSRMKRAGIATAAGGAGGAAEGAISGFGEGEGNVENRLARAMDESISGGAWGTAGGPFGLLMAKAIPPMVRGAKSLTDKLTGGTGKTPLTGIVEALGLTKENFPSFVRAAEADAALTAAGQGRRSLGRAGPNAMVMDTGTAMQEMADAAVRAGGPGARKVTEAIRGRVDEGGMGVRQSLDESLGEPVGLTVRQRAMRAANEEEIRAKYKKAYGRMISPDKAFSALVGRVDKSTHNLAREMMVKELGKVPKEGAKSTMYLDYLTRALNDQKSNEGALGGLTSIGRVNVRLAQDIRGKLKTLNPDYGKALAEGREAIEDKQALDYGYKLLDPGTKMDKAQLDIEDIFSDKKQLLAEGARDFINDKVSNVVKEINSPTGDVTELLKEINYLRTDAAKNKLAMVLPPETLNKLLTKVAEAEQAILLKRGVRAGSQTAQRTATDKATEEAFKDPSDFVKETVGTGGFQNPLVKAISTPFRRGAAGQEAFEERYRSTGADFLTRKNPVEATKNLRRAKDYERLEKRARGRAKALTTLATPMTVNQFVDSQKKNRRPNRGEE